MRIRRILVAFGAALALFCVAPGAAPPATATDGTAAIKGQVLSWMDPIGDVRVTVFNADTGAVVASVQTDGEGYYLVSGLRARHVKVRATKAGYLAAWASGVGTRAAATIYTLVPGQTLEQTWDEQRVLYLDLTPEGVVTGTVVGVNENPAAGPDGGPLAGARVTVVDQRTGGRIGSAVTDADGRFRIGMLAAGSVRVKAAKAGWLTAWAPNHPMGEVVDFPVLAGQVTDIGMFRLYAPATVFGEVVSNHHRIRGTARLTVFNADTGKAIRSLTVGSRFRITGLAPGTIQVRVTKHGYVDGWSSLLTLKAGQVLGPHVEQGALRIELTRGAVVTGEVMGFSQSPTAGWDDPLPGVKVTAVNARTGRKVAAGLTDESGRFRIGVVGVRTVKVKAAKTGWLTSWAPGERTRAEGDRITLRLGEVTDIGTVAVYAPAAIEGQVLSSMDPIGYATVKVFDAGTHQVIGSTVTDGSGQYRIDGLWPTPVKVRASLTHYTTNWADSFAQRDWNSARVFDLVPGQVLAQTWSPTASLYLDIAREAVIEGQVLGESRPLGGARVTVFNAVTGVAIRSVTADSLGYYRIDRIGAFGGASVKVSASKPGWQTSWANGKWTMAEADAFVLYPGDLLQQSWDPRVLYLNLSRPS